MKASRPYRKSTSITLIGTALFVLTALFAVGCQASTVQTETPTAEPRQPFSARSESENGTVVSWSGYADGYRAGQEAAFEIAINNGSDQPWKGRYCLHLLGPGSPRVITTLVERDIDLEPGMGFSDTLQAEMPESLEPGDYGLAMVVHRPQGPMANFVSIQAGESAEVRQAATQDDMDAALEACPPRKSSAASEQVNQAKKDLSQRLEIDPAEISLRSVEETEFSDASLGVPEAGKSYAQVITPGFVIQLEVNDQTYRYHASEQRVVFVPPESTLTPTPPDKGEETLTIDTPQPGMVTTLPLHIFARGGQPGQEIKATLRWEGGTELTSNFTTLEGPDGKGLLIKSIDWQTAAQPPQPDTDQATLTLEDQAGTKLAQQQITLLSAEDPQTRLIDLFWLLGEEPESEQRRIVHTGSVEAAAVRELLWGPPPRNLAGFRTALPTPEEVLSYPGRSEDWGVRVKLLGLTIEDGTATVNFSQEINAYGGGSARVNAIRQQVTRTLTQFDTVDEVVIAVAGETEAVLQP